jgi:hypothetical protein
MPRTIETTVYTASELRELHPDGFARALDRHHTDFEFPRELMDSFRALCNAAGVSLDGWEIDPYGTSWARIRPMRENWYGEHDFLDLCGPRALAWLENRVLSPLRLSFTNPRRWELCRYGERAGAVQSCPFTGCYYDENILAVLRSSLRGGATVRDAFAAVVDELGAVARAELEDWSSADYFIEHADANFLSFTESGEIA